MSASHAPVLDAITFQLLDALEKYDRDFARMVDTWLDMDLYGDVSDQVEAIRTYCGTLPELSVQWAELLIAHAELVHMLWRLRFEDSAHGRERLHAMRERHSNCIALLGARCRRLLGRGARDQKSG